MEVRAHRTDDCFSLPLRDFRCDTNKIRFCLLYRWIGIRKEAVSHVEDFEREALLGLILYAVSRIGAGTVMRESARYGSAAVS